MPAPEFDWTFADAPDPDAPPGDAPSLKKTPAAPHRWPRLSPRQSRLLAAGVAIALLAGAGAWLFTRLGLRRLQAGLAAQIVYEDQRAQAGDAAAVLALQGREDASWRDEQAARVRLGLAAPLPAGDLWPTTHPPRLLKLDPLGGDLFAATVSRDYTDLSGHTVTFDLLERYRNLSPTAWEHLPPDASVLSATTPFEGQRLTAAVPTVDLPWLGPALLQADDLLVQTCADWGDLCPPGNRLVVNFGASPELDRPALTAGERVSNSPLIFYLPPAVTLDCSACYAVAAPLLAGRPREAAAQAALSHSLSVQLLGAFAGEVSGGHRTPDDYFLDALLARAEVRRLGASAAPQAPAPQNYIALAALWAESALRTTPASSWRADLPLRREAFDFLNSALAGQRPSVDGTLLRALRRGQGVDDWLAAALGRGALALPAAWDQQALAAFAARAPAGAGWAEEAGLVLACQDGLYQLEAGGPRLASRLNTGSDALTIGDRSPDGRYLALEIQRVGSTGASSPMTELLVMNLTSGASASVWQAPVVVLYGWSAAGELVYAVNSSQASAAPDEAFVLMGYTAATGHSRLLIPDRVLPPDNVHRDLWSADHTRLLLARLDPLPNAPLPQSLAVLSFGPPVSLLRRDQAVGSALSLSPDGQRVAYVKFPDHMVEATTPGWETNWLNVFDLASGAVTTLAATNDPRLPADLAGFAMPHWSADGAEVGWYAAQMGPNGNMLNSVLLTAPAGGGPVRVWGSDGQNQIIPLGFAPDGQYLAAITLADWPARNQYWLFDQQGAGVPRPRAGWAESLAWAPTGHQLVIANANGVSALDPATGAWAWLGPWPECQVRW